MNQSRISIALVLAVLLCVGTASAQVCPSPTPFAFDGLNGSGLPAFDNEAILNLITLGDSTDAINFDNTAHVGLGEGALFTFEDARVPAGSPFAITLSVGVPSIGVSNPATIDGLVWIDAANPGNLFHIIDGIGLAGPPNPFATTPGPGFENQLFINVSQDGSLVGLCIVVQAIVIDPLAPPPFNIALSNPIAVGFQPTVASVFASITQPGGTVQVTAAGSTPAGGDIITFANNETTTTSANGFATVPLGAVSGKVRLNVNGIPSIESDDDIRDWVAVTDSNTITTPGLLTPAPIPVLANTSRATGIASLAGAGQSDTWSVNLNSGDILDVEVYSIDAGQTRILDGRGSGPSPFIIEGFDPNVTLQIGNASDPLVFDTATGPQNIHFDDDGGPVFNSRLQWQARSSGAYNITVGDADPGVFVTGDYLINVTVTSGVPSVRQFTNPGNLRVNIVAQNGNVRIMGDNILTSRSYTVTMKPRVGSTFADRVFQNLVPTIAGRLQINAPGAGVAGQLPMGIHQVVITDETTGLSGLAWDNSQFTPADGVLPDLLCIRGATRTTAVTNAATGNITDVTALNTESIIFMPPNLTTVAPFNLGNGFVRAMDPGGSTVSYCEALGLSESNFELFDSTTDSATTPSNGIYNPIVNSFYPLLAFSGPYNDNDGIIPFGTTPSGLPMGIGRSAAFLDFNGPALFPGGGNYLFLVRENILFGPTPNHACLVNIVFQ